MNFSDRYTKVFQYLLPSPFTIALILTLITFLIALVFTQPTNISTAKYAIEVIGFWEEGLWQSNLMVFAMQMMLILVLGHVLALAPVVDRFLTFLVKFATNTANAVLLVCFFTIAVALFNWGLGLIFGAIFARKVAEHAQKNHLSINYPLIGAAGYSGLMVWHGGISGSSLTKVAETGHLKEMMQGIFTPTQLSNLPDQITFSETVFSAMNGFASLSVLIILPLFLFFIARKGSNNKIPNLKERSVIFEREEQIVGAERLDKSKLFAYAFGFVILFYAIYKAAIIPSNSSFDFITPNYLNFVLLGLGIFLHGTFSKFLNAVNDAIGGASGILIQFPLYFGIMGMMKESGLVSDLSDFFIHISNETTFPLFTMLSAGIVNVFIPSGGGQWAVQGPIIIQASEALGISLPRSIMALAYGDQLTNMLQPFWALPLLGITGLKAKEILPYTLLLMLVGALIYILALILF